MNRRRSKKSETIEVRLEHEVKTALMRKAQQEGRSASEVMRQFIDLYLAEKPKEANSMIVALWKPATAIGAASVAALVAMVGPAPLHAKPDVRAIFQSLDRNADGAISMQEFQQHASNPEIQKAHEAHRAKGKGAAGHGHGHGAQAGHAQPTPEMIRTHFAKLDSNSDGSIQLTEVEKHHDEMERSHKKR